jgi:asparagine synthase (glutamine-hydrolysing)
MGFCIGDETFHSEWKQVLAGEEVRIDKRSGEVTRHRQWPLENRRYQSFESDRDALTAGVDSIHAMWSRWWPYLKRQHVVLPLSGGYDSRLLLSLAVQSGHDNITCYSYGTDVSFEVQKAREVAKALGVDHVVIDLDATSWDSFDSAYIQDFLVSAHTCMATPQLIEAVTMDRLRQRLDLSRDTIIVPGHSGDLLGGSHLPSPSLLQRETFSRNDIVTELCRHHGRLVPPKKLEKDIIETQLQGMFEDRNYTRTEFVDALEYWNLQNRQSKFIINTARAIESVGLKWAMPLWDADLAEFWYGLPLSYRDNNQLFNTCLNTAFFEPLNIAIPAHVPSTKGHLFSALKAVVPNRIYQASRHLSKSLLRRKIDYNATQPLNDLLQSRLSPPLSWHEKEDHACLTEWVVQQFYS